MGNSRWNSRETSTYRYTLWKMQKPEQAIKRQSEIACSTLKLHPHSFSFFFQMRPNFFLNKPSLNQRGTLRHAKICTFLMEDRPHSVWKDSTVLKERWQFFAASTNTFVNDSIPAPLVGGILYWNGSYFSCFYFGLSMHTNIYFTWFVCHFTMPSKQYVLNWGTFWFSLSLSLSLFLYFSYKP